LISDDHILIVMSSFFRFPLRNVHFYKIKSFLEFLIVVKFSKFNMNKTIKKQRFTIL